MPRTPHAAAALAPTVLAAAALIRCACHVASVMLVCVGGHASGCMALSWSIAGVPPGDMGRPLAMPPPAHSSSSAGELLRGMGRPLAVLPPAYSASSAAVPRRGAGLPLFMPPPSHSASSSMHAHACCTAAGAPPMAAPRTRHAAIPNDASPRCTAGAAATAAAAAAATAAAAGTADGVAILCC
eukprot:365137-Chlamydomonas_euryale.AAC.5